MTIRAVLFDFSDTLFRLEHADTWLIGHEGVRLDIEARTELMRRMRAPVNQTVELDAEHLHAWTHRDRDPELHRKVYVELLKKSGIPRHEHALAFYEQLTDPSQWRPYPDTETALKSTSEQGLKVGVLSNIAFDIRPAFTARGWHVYIDEFVLSYEIGSVKPELAFFSKALAMLGVRATETLMVGDSEEADGAVRTLGCQFALVEPLPPAERPDALLTALRQFGIGQA